MAEQQTAGAGVKGALGWLLAQKVDGALAQILALVGIVDMPNPVIEHPAVVVAAYTLNVVFDDEFDAALDVAGSVADITRTQ